MSGQKIKQNSGVERDSAASCIKLRDLSGSSCRELSAALNEAFMIAAAFSPAQMGAVWR